MPLITVRELDAGFLPTGRTFTGSIEGNTGRFTVRGIFSYPFVELSANGFYFNEIADTLSAAQINLLALADLSDSTTVNINLLTHLERPRVFALIDSGLSFSAAKAQAQGEVLSAFNIAASAIGSSESLDISQAGEGNAILLAISVILQANRSEAQLTELLSTLSSDLRTDGVLNSAATRQKLIDGMEYVKPRRVAIRSNILARYTELGAPADVPDFAAYAFTLDTAAPSVSSSVPAAGANQEIDAVTLAFSELMEHDTLDSSTVQLLNAQGSPVAGMFSRSDSDAATTVTFTLENMLTPGAYQMVVSPGAKDLAGNGLAAQTIIALTHAQIIRDLQIVRSGGSQPVSGSSIIFTATVAAGSNINYNWSLGDGATATGQSTTHSHAVADRYRVIVTATNSVSSMAIYTDILYAGWTEREIRIPAGSFQMGCDSSNSAETCGGNEQPLHAVTLDAYSIDKYEVTNARYQACVTAGGCTAPRSVNSRTRFPYYGTSTYADYPVIKVTWHQASAFCAWAGKRLPTEAEWEKAARGSSGTRKYPWGDSAPDCTKLNYYHYNGVSYEYCVGDTSRVGFYPSGASPYGVMDMAGNVWEWVNDWYDDSYYSVSPSVNPQGPATGSWRVGRCGSWSDFDLGVRSALRGYDIPYGSGYGGGFRCVRSP